MNHKFLKKYVRKWIIMDFLAFSVLFGGILVTFKNMQRVRQSFKLQTIEGLLISFKETLLSYYNAYHEKRIV